MVALFSPSFSTTTFEISASLLAPDAAAPSDWRGLRVS
jgi:hypothetical protein